MTWCQSRECGAEIDWALSADESKHMPVTRSSAGEPDGTLAVWRDETHRLRYRNLAAGEEPAPGEKRGRSHYKDCADPQRFSRGNR